MGQPPMMGQSPMMGQPPMMGQQAPLMGQQAPLMGQSPMMGQPPMMGKLGQPVNLLNQPFGTQGSSLPGQSGSFPPNFASNPKVPPK